MNELLKLAERCEAATEADETLDYEIREATGIGYKGSNWIPQTAFTAHLDAAMTLVPEDRFVGALNQCDVGGEWYARVECHHAVYEDGTAAAPALALCAAALRALAAQEPSS